MIKPLKPRMNILCILLCFSSVAYGAGCNEVPAVKLDIERLSESVRLGDEKAMVQLGSALLTGEGIKQDVEKGIDMLQAAARKNNAESFFILANYYGKLAESDNKYYPLVLDYLNKSIEYGNVRARLYLGTLYLSGKGVQLDIGRAYELMSSAANSGDSLAEIALGSALIDGGKLKQDKDAGISFLKKASDKGECSAKYILAAFYLNDYQSSDKVEAARTLLEEVYESQSNISADAAYLLGRIYMDDQYGMSDATKAAYWFEISEKSNISDSTERLKKMRSCMIKKEITGCTKK